MNEMKKLPRGSFDHATDDKSGFVDVRWNDNIVNAASNKVEIHPLQKANRWSRSEKKRVNIEQEYLIKHYNRGCAGSTVWTKMLRSIAQQSDPKNGGHCLHTVSICVCSRYGICIVQQSLPLTNPSTSWPSVDPSLEFTSPWVLVM